MPSTFTDSLFDYLNAIYRYWLVAVCALIVGVTITLVTVRMLPDVFRSTTLILVEPQDVPEAYVRATVTSRLESRLQAMNQEVLSRTRLESVIKDFGLYPEARAQGRPMERIVDMMRKNIFVEVYAQNNGFRISYDGSDPNTVQRVTARLASMYIDENLRIRDEQVTGTTEFMESELEKARRQLDTQEAAIQGYKEQHMGELPEQRDANMRSLEGNRMQLQTITVALSAAQERKVLLEKQIADARAFRSALPSVDGRPAADSPNARLRQLEAELVDLRGRYTAEHPDVVQTQAQIARLRAELAGSDDDKGRPTDPLVPPDLAHALEQTQLDITRLKAEEERINKAIEVFGKRVENAFVREQELLGLTRDYDVTKRKYQTLLDKKLEAQLSQSLERRQKAERFRVLDPANRPQMPAKPNRQVLYLGGVAVSIGLACLLPILLWQIDSSFHAPEDFAAAELPVLAVIPQALTRDVQRRQQRYRVRVLGATVVALVVGLGTASFYAKYLF
jgi:polysaccharide chain length determinant protein (PEP-CTERM system associated)